VVRLWRVNLNAVTHGHASAVIRLSMMMVVIIMVRVMIVIARPARAPDRAGFGTLDGRRAHERIGTEHEATSDGLAGLGMFGQRRILDRLAQFESPHLFARPRHGFIDVGDHSAEMRLHSQTRGFGPTMPDSNFQTLTPGSKGKDGVDWEAGSLSGPVPVVAG
jgi:hypothetical protein